MSVMGPVLGPVIGRFRDWYDAIPVTVAPRVFVVDQASAGVKLLALAVA